MQEEQQPAKDEPQSQWEYKSEDEASTTSPEVTRKPSEVSVKWTASEYIAHEKSAGWYALLGVAVAIAALLVYVFTRDIVSGVVIGIIGMAFGVFAARRPKELEYAILPSGVHIGQRRYEYERLKSFSLVHEGPVRAIIITPLQRFSLPISIYFASEDEQKIVDTLSNYLPYEERDHDIIDRAMKKIRF